MKISFGGEYRARNLTTAKDKIFVSATTSEEWVNVILNYNSAIGDEQYTISATPNDNKITYANTMNMYNLKELNLIALT